jgi:hypothetical protein
MSIKDISLIFLWFLIVTVSTAVTYRVYVVDKEYQLLTIISCDPSEVDCFVSGNQKEKHFQYIKKLAKNTIDCDARSETCKPLQCKMGEEKCEIISCNVDTLREYAYDGVSCTDQVVVKEKPIEVKEETVVPAVKVEPPAPVEVPRAPIDSNQEEAIPQAPEPTPAPVSPAPEEDIPEPSHNLPI